MIDTTINKTGNSGRYLLPLWKTERNNEKKQALKDQRKKSPTASSSNSLPSMEDSFMYIGMSGKIYGRNVLVIFESTNIDQFSDLSFLTNGFQRERASQ